MGHPIQQRVTEQAVLAATPFALVFASKVQRILTAPLLEPCGADTGTVPGRNLKTRPISGAVPGLVKNPCCRNGVDSNAILPPGEAASIGRTAAYVSSSTNAASSMTIMRGEENPRIVFGS